MKSPVVFNARNVNHALALATSYFRNAVPGAGYVRRIAPRDPSKGTLEVCAPVLTHYERPLERVLFHPARDANPFFHFFESLWILAGRNDVSWLAYFLKNIADYSDNGLTFHGAYGRRMLGQVEAAIAELHNDRNSRRAVVALWQPAEDCGYTGRDMPCNCTVTFKLRDGELNMTVFNRSNDMVWGAYGANAVQFSTLQEYVAAMLDASVGSYVQFSDSFHVYEEQPAWKTVHDRVYLVTQDPYEEPQAARDFGFHKWGECVKPYRMVKEPGRFMANLHAFMDVTQAAMSTPSDGISWYEEAENPYFHEVAVPLFNSFAAYKRRAWDDALHWALACMASDWALAAAMWIYRRKEAAAAKETASA